jgi:hypothetical protein
MIRRCRATRLRGVFTTVLLTEKALSAHDIERFAHLHDPEPVHIHVVVPAHDDRSDLAETIDDMARTDFSDAFHDADAGRSEEDLATSAHGEVEASVAGLRAAGVAEVDGEVSAQHPVDRVIALVGELDADEVVVLTEPHLLADWTRRDWASRLRHVLDKPVLHVVLGTDQVVS